MRLLTLALATLTAASAGAQTTPEPGQRVRLELRDGRRLVGRIERVETDTLQLRPHNTTYTAPVVRDSIAALAVSLGRSHGAGARRGLKVGAIVGGGILLAALGAGAIHDLTAGCGDCYIPATGVAAVLGSAAFFGTTVGGTVIGALVGRERWGPRTTLGLRLAR